MIKKTTALLVLITAFGALDARAEAGDHPFSEHGDRKRLALNVIGVGGAITACGLVFFFVGRSGASLHVNADGSLKPRGLLEEARSATSLQRVSVGVLLVGLVTTITGTVLLLNARQPAVSLSPTYDEGEGGLVLTGAF